MKKSVIEYALSQRDRFEEAKDLYDHVITVFGPGSIGYSTLTEHLRQHVWAGREATRPQKRGPKLDNQLEVKIRRLLEADPKLSANEIAAQLGRSPSTVKRYLHEVLQFEFKKTRWVPHFLTDTQKNQRKELSSELIDVLDSASTHNFRFLVTGDESWFFYRSPNNGLWMPKDAPRPESQRPSHYGDKTMIVIFWNLDGPLIVEAVPEGRSADAYWFRDNILAEICKSKPYKAAKKQRRKLVTRRYTGQLS